VLPSMHTEPFIDIFPLADSRKVVFDGNRR
jgi:hypothetical protein